MRVCVWTILIGLDALTSFFTKLGSINKLSPAPPSSGVQIPLHYLSNLPRTILNNNMPNRYFYDHHVRIFPNYDCLNWMKFMLSV